MCSRACIKVDIPANNAYTSPGRNPQALDGITALSNSYARPVIDAGGWLAARMMRAKTILYPPLTRLLGEEKNVCCLNVVTRR
jgi:transposase InsO family protein